MLDTDFFLDGVSARSKGIYCGSPVSFSAAVPRISAVQIPGRSGDLLQDDGGYYNISAKVDRRLHDHGAGCRNAEIDRHGYSYMKLVLCDASVYPVVPFSGRQGRNLLSYIYPAENC